MVSIIKLGDHLRDNLIKPARFDAIASVAPTPDPHELELAVLRGRVAELTDALRLRDRQIDEGLEAVERAHETGRVTGKREGEAEAQGRADELTERVERGVAQAVALLQEEMRSLSRLAYVVAESGLAKLIGDANGCQAVLAQLIDAQIKGLNRESVLRIDVSRLDFPTDANLRDLMDRLDSPGLAVHAVDGLASGGCHIKLTLGGIDAGLNQQWSALRDLLQEFAAPEAPA